MDKNTTIRIELNEQQREQVQASVGKDADALEFTGEQLEDRIAPIRAM